MSTAKSGGGVVAALVEKAMQREPERRDSSERRAVLLRSRCGGQWDLRADGGEKTGWLE